MTYSIEISEGKSKRLF